MSVGDVKLLMSIIFVESFSLRDSEIRMKCGVRKHYDF